MGMNGHVNRTTSEEPIFAELVAEKGDVLEETQAEVERADEALETAADFDEDSTEQ